MQKDDLVRLRHMLDAAREALSFSLPNLTEVTGESHFT